MLKALDISSATARVVSELLKARSTVDRNDLKTIVEIRKKDHTSLDDQQFSCKPIPNILKCREHQ